jgi:hypothetical protein
MRCLSCNVILSDRESTRKGVHTGEYLDLCDDCIATIPDFEYTENPLTSNNVPREEHPPEEDGLDEGI